MKISEAVSFPFRGPHAWPNIGLIMVCLIIPFVGPMVVQGYIIGAEKILITNIHADAPRFEFAYFSRYLQRGLYPFLASLVLTMVVFVVVIPLSMIIFLGVLLLQNHVAAMIALAVICALLYLLSIIIIGTVIQPLIFKSGLEGTFEAAFDRAFCFDYFKRVGWYSLGIHLLAMLMAVPLVITICVPYIGPMAALAAITQFQAHLNTQLYLTYLERGGTPLKILNDPLGELLPPAFPVQPPAPAAIQPTLDKT